MSFFLAVKLADQVRTDEGDRIGQNANGHHHGDGDAKYVKGQVQKPADAQNIEHRQCAKEHSGQNQKESLTSLFVDFRRDWHGAFFLMQADPRSALHGS